MSSPYGRKPKAQSDPNQWHEISFMISIDYPVDWDNIDLRKWAQTVSRFTALLMGKSALSAEELEEVETIKAYMMSVKVSRVSLATDDELHSMIDGFGDDDIDTE